VGVHGVPCGTLLATNITVVLRNFHVLRLNVVEHMVFLRAPVLAHQASELRGGEPAEVLLQLLTPAPAWGGRGQPGHHRGRAQLYRARQTRNNPSKQSSI